MSSELITTTMSGGGTLLRILLAVELDEWRPIPGYEAYYEVPARGKVRSLVRVGGNNRRYGGKVLAGAIGEYGYAYVVLCVKNRRRSFRVHELVAMAFLGEKPEWAECVRHDDGDPANNWATNLFYATDSENAYDRVRHGRHHEANKKTCKFGHDLVQGKSQRYCPTCKPILDHASYARRRELASV